MNDEWRDLLAAAVFALDATERAPAPQHPAIKRVLRSVKSSDRLPAKCGAEQKVAALEPRQLLQDLDHVIRQRHQMGGVGLHSLGGNCPELLCEIEFRPARFADF